MPSLKKLTSPKKPLDYALIGTIAIGAGLAGYYIYEKVVKKPAAAEVTTPATGSEPYTTAGLDTGGGVVYTPTTTTTTTTTAPVYDTKEVSGKWHVYKDGVDIGTFDTWQEAANFIAAAQQYILPTIPTPVSLTPAAPAAAKWYAHQSGSVDQISSTDVIGTFDTWQEANDYVSSRIKPTPTPTPAPAPAAPKWYVYYAWEQYTVTQSNAYTTGFGIVPVGTFNTYQEAINYVKSIGGTVSA